MQETQVRSLCWEYPLEKHTTPVFLPGEFHGQRSLATSQSMGLLRVRFDRRNNTFTLLENKIIWIYRIMKDTCRNLVFYFKVFFFYYFRERYEIFFHLKSTALGSLKVNLILLESDFHYKQKGSVIPPRYRRTRDSNQMTSSLISNMTILPGSYSLKSVKKILKAERC